MGCGLGYDTLTSLIGLKLGLQVFRRDVEFLFRSLAWSWFTLAAAAVTATAQATAEITARSQAAENKQSL